ncbi:hypothetical protein SAMN06265360_10279 [Haloechinothrix alba]|uniref:DUF6542 domain-containing protein n=1 Tax=Haloechinothrix alba TaxID=664784 RepID=A0A238VDD2_9PSEU|nr:DUF6542 domain-containing protein [Haloechinothrix alba]SNR32174.1 hypothetical protein SAMN06265360_10279 [Haloechinothrix alba]
MSTSGRDDQDSGDEPVPWDERPIAGSARGLSWPVAVAIALGLTLGGAILDMQLRGGLDTVFQVGFVLGCVAAICAVRRRNLFGPIVQPPLILAFTVPGVVLYASGMPEGTGTMSRAIAVGTPLVDNFPTMAATTVATIGIGLLRLVTQRDPDGKAIKRTSRTRQGGDKTKGREGKSAQRSGSGSARDSARHPKPERQREREPAARPAPPSSDPPVPRREPRRSTQDTRGPRPWDSERQERPAPPRETGAPSAPPPFLDEQARGRPRPDAEGRPPRRPRPPRER